MTSHPEALTDRELENVTAVFRSFESGLREATISSHDLHKALLMLGFNPSEQEVVDIPNEIARKGLIYFPDFCDLCLERFREGKMQMITLGRQYLRSCVGLTHSQPTT